MKIGIVCASGLGDALMAMVLSHHLRQDHQVTTFSNSLTSMHKWFPEQTITPYPEAKELKSFDYLLFQDHCPEHLVQSCLDSFTFKENQFNKKKSIVENYLDFLKNRFQIEAKRYNGLIPLQGLSFRKHPKRVLLHCFCTEEKRCYPVDKFITIAKELKNKGLDPLFIGSPKELAEIQPLVNSCLIPDVSSLDDVASLIYESGYLIGNNSGLGHLASNMQIPTCSIFAKYSYARLWAPDFLKAHVIASPTWVLGSRNKQRFFKRFLSPNTVVSAFMRNIHDKKSLF